jgi:hypothetical protein
MDGKPHLVPNPEPGKGVWEYEPPISLFSEFATLETTASAIKGFADKYGDLFASYDEPDHVALDGTVSFGASLKRWQSEIGDMRALVDLWGHVQQRRLSELKNVVTWKKTEAGDDEVSYVLRTPRGRRNVTLFHSALGESRFRRPDVLLPSRCALQLEINKRLAEHSTIPRLAWTPDYQHRIIFKSPHLLAAMWLQFAQAVTGEFQLKRCVVCGKFFQVGPGGRRADSMTCTDACRQQKSRQSKRRS